MTPALPTRAGAAPARDALPDRQGDFAFTDADFRRVATIAQAEFGLHLQSSKKSLIYSRLTRRLRQLGMTAFSDYLDLIEVGSDLAEREVLISALTTNVTHFFREAHHFEQFESEVLPPLVARARSGGRVRLWSAGCSSGQEPYSLSTCILRLCPEAARLDLRLLATDIDGDILARAEAGRYSLEERARLSPERATALFAPGAGEPRAIRPEVAALVSFRRLNLIDRWPMRGRFDAIFCRNVAIYFDKPVQERLWQRFAEQLSPGGYLFIGHSERLTGPASAGFASVGITVYRRPAQGAPQLARED